MGKGIEAARALDPVAAQAMEDMRDQLLIVFLKRLGGKVSVPCDEVDATGGVALRIAIDPVTRVFHFDLAPHPENH